MIDKKNIFIIVPSAVLDSPIKGAIALANELSKSHHVSFVTLKPNIQAYRLINNNVVCISLGQLGWVQKYRKLRQLLREAGGRGQAITISSSFSADLFNSWCSDLAITCGSVRGNLPKVYPMTYGRLGVLLALFHFSRLKKLDLVISMTNSMSKQVASFIGRTSPVIGNFVDEEALDVVRPKSRRKGAYRFVFTGSLIAGKNPHLLLDALNQLKCQGESVKLDFYGSGPLLNSLIAKTEQLGLSNLVSFNGYTDEPFKEVSESDVFVLPSVSEGVSRSVLEALYLGVPCVLKDVDGNSELVTDQINGYLFKSDNELADVMIKTAKWSRSRIDLHGSLLPINFRQKSSAAAYLELVRNVYD